MSNKNLILNKLNLLQKQKDSKKHWNITWSAGVFLSNLIEIKQPKTILEIGTSNGFSTLFLAKNLEQTGTIDTIDINKERLDQAKNTFHQCKLENITTHQGDVFEIIPKFQKKKKFDLIFVDAAQMQYKEIVEQLESLKLLNKDYIMIFDNILSHGTMQDFVDYMQTKCLCEIIKIGSGLLMAKKR